MKIFEVMELLVDLFSACSGGRQKLREPLPPFWNKIAIAVLLLIVIGFPLLFFIRYVL